MLLPPLVIAPPARYDHQPVAAIYERLEYVQMVRTCAKPPPGTYALGCSHVGPDGVCVVYLPARSWEPPARDVALLIRHENAHCNGWPASHPKE